ncbi:Utp14 protein-domain-containing protein [Echria macrotheca]|uniref:Utp14 protein-domain-containing protein n=1 Tax=Echria macrotheca TaxID=438768 RepID=A0AAJ0BEC9_9PEZI|nr:Utp14 protein-domain-containing protein [Echria macrotheca]
MPGRQAHGRSLLPASGPKKPRKPSSRARATKALDAFAIAEQQVPSRKPKGVRTRDLDSDPAERSSNKRQHGGDDDDDDEDEDDEDAGPPVKKRARKGGDEDDFDGFSGGDDDGDEEEWHVGVEEGDEDSEIDSDEAFGESDEEKFEGYAFGGKPKKKKSQNDDEEEDDEDLESLGSDAIDLATALDQYEEDESEDEEEGSGSEEESSQESSESEDDDDHPSKLDALQDMIAGFAGDDSDEEEPTGPKQKSKISLKDLGLAGVKDPHIKKSLKLMNKEEKATKPGSSKKLDVPLAKRQQDRLLRAAAYEKTTETLDRWIDTVKQNRRADHLFFPLAQNAHNAGLDNGELMPLTKKNTGTELEQTILTIMEESGLGPSAKPAKETTEGETAAEEKLSMAEQIELARQRRKERELHSREAARAKRIKKIKSKAYRRIHRKEALRDAEAIREAGDLDSDEEREAADRRRALERVGTKHRESKWAKLGKKAGRAVWDDDFRAGLTEMAQRKEELRRRVEGRAKDSDDEDDDDDDMSDASDDAEQGFGKRRLLEELERAAAYEDEKPTSGIMAMKFMQNAEAERKKENDELVASIRRQLDSDEEDDSEDVDVGRKKFGMGLTPAANPFLSGKGKKTSGEAAEPPASKAKAISTSVSAAAERDASPPAPSAGAGGWSRVGQEGRKKKVPKGAVDELDLSNAGMLATKKAAKPKAAASGQTAEAEAQDSDDEAAVHLPIAIRDQKLIEMAFAGEDVMGDFEREKAEMEKEDDDKEVDNSLPGWGGWVGEGISSREKRRQMGRNITKIEGIKKKDRQDFKLKGVIISERRIKKNDKYLASQLPHPYESHQQYERSLRLPIGPEWSTKETFQGATKPRVIVKQGIIAPMSKPMV